MKLPSRTKQLAMAAGFFLAIPTHSVFPQHQPTPQQQAGITKDAARHFGDAPDDGGPLARDISYSTKPAAVKKAMRKVADWQLARSEPYFDRIWTWSVLYSGFMAASDSLDDPKYRDAMLAMSRKFDWKLRSHLPDADDQSIAQTYLEFYLNEKEPAMLKPTQMELDAILAVPRESTIPRKEITWWWCDALFMAPPVWAQMYAATGDRKYIDYLDQEWAKTSARLYNTTEHLYARDSTYLARTEANGKKMFWSRGNGWVMGGIIRTLEYLPNDDPARATYITQLQQMAARVAQLQGPDGLWRAGLLDPDDYDLPEVSGSAFFTYALAAGVNKGWLDAKAYRPVIERSWAGMLHHVYADGRLGCIQQTGAEPAPYKATASYTYGVGAFLLAGSEIRKMDRTRKHGR
ncbi:MAG: glycoside hydrolase family 88 protein [Terracidiphilus sp.]|jgi:rhamnogalacturonyl hydrolase YesR